MFRNRNFLLGLGLGLIFGSVLLQLMLSANVQQAKLNSMDKLTGGEAAYTQEEADRLVADAVAKAVKEAAENGGTPDGDGEDSEDGKMTGVGGGKAKPGGGAENAAAETQKTGGASSEDVQVKLVRISKGATSEQVAALLRKEGVIRDEKAFVKLMSDSATQIQVGKFLFINHPSPAKVKEIITSPPFAS